MALGKGCTAVDVQIVQRMQEIVVCKTDEGLTEQFGISYNTWRKLVSGKEIRASVADRLIRRLNQMDMPRSFSRSQ